MKADVVITTDGDRMKFVDVDKGLIAAAFSLEDELFLRAQLDPNVNEITWEEAWVKVMDHFGVDKYNSMARIVEFKDGTEMRQLFMGKK